MLKFKRIFSLILVVSMLSSLGVTGVVSAAGSTDEDLIEYYDHVLTKTNAALNDMINCSDMDVNENFYIKYTVKFLTANSQFGSFIYINGDRVRFEARPTFTSAALNENAATTSELNVEYDYLVAITASGTTSVYRKLAADKEYAFITSSTTRYADTAQSRTVKFNYVTDVTASAKVYYTAVVSSEKAKLEPVNTAYMREDFENGLNNWTIDTDSAYINTGSAKCSAGNVTLSGTQDFYIGMRRAVGVANEIDEGTFTIRCKLDKHTRSSGFALYLGKKRVYFHLVDGQTAIIDSTVTRTKKVGDEVYEWHTYRFEIDGDYATVYCDDEVLYETYEMQDSVKSLSYIDVWSRNKLENGEGGGWTIDYMEYEPFVPQLSIDSVADGAEYIEGEPITFTSSTKMSGIDYMEYYANGIKIGEGTAPDYKFEWNNSNSGAYKVYAICGNEKSKMLDVNIQPSAEAVITLPEQVTTNDAVTVQADIYDRYERCEYISCLVNGNEVDGSRKNISEITDGLYSVNVGKLSSGGNSVQIKLGLDNGNISVTEPEYITVLPYNEQTEMPNVYTLEYTAADGSAIDIKNTKYNLYVAHGAESVTYKSADGEASFEGKAGSYRIDVHDAFADIYYEGKLIKSFVMPQTPESGKAVIGINDMQISIPKGNEVIIKQAIKGGEKTEIPIYGLSQSYGAEFEMKKGETGSLIIYDGGFPLDFDIKADGLYGTNYYEGGAATYEDYRHYERIGNLPEDERVLYRIEVVRGIASVYANGYVVATMMLSENYHTPMLFAEFSADTEIWLRNVSRTYDYYENFDGKGENDAEHYWDFSKMTSVSNTGSGIMTVVSSGDAGKMLSNSNVKNPDFKARVKINDLKGGMWIVFRHATEGEEFRIGYDATKFQYRLDKITGTDIKNLAKSVALPPTKRYINVQLVANEYDVTLYVDGKAVISGTVDEINHGRIGFMLENGSMDIDSVAFVSDTIPVAGMKSYSIYDTRQTLDVIKKNDGSIIAGGESHHVLSFDPVTEEWTALPKDSHITCNMVRAKSGRIICREYVYRGDLKFYLSDDDGKTWRTVTYADPEGYDIRNGMPGKLYVSPVTNRIFWPAYRYEDVESSAEDTGNAIVYYSDDEGETWHTSKTWIKEADNNMAVAEMQIVDLPDGTVVMWSRTGNGHYIFFESKDGGVTFDKQYTRSVFAGTRCAFGIERDPYNTDHYYMLWQYDNLYEYPARPQLPRSRVALAVSYDGCKTWQYVGDMINYDTADAIGKGITVQMNQSISILEDYVIASWAVDEPLKATGVDYAARMVMIKKDMIEPLAAFTPMYMHGTTEMSAFAKKLIEGSIVYKADTGEFVVNGENYNDNSCPDGYVPVELAAKLANGYFDVSTVTDGNGAEYDRISITAGDCSYKMTVGEKKFFADSLEYPCEKPLICQNGKYYIPAESLATMFNCYLIETEAGYTFIINREITNDDIRVVERLF